MPTAGAEGGVRAVRFDTTVPFPGGSAMPTCHGSGGRPRMATNSRQPCRGSPWDAETGRIEELW